MSERFDRMPRERPLRLTEADRLLMLAPHPDDEALAAGGLLQHAVERGAGVRVLYVSSGENNPWAQRANEWKWRLGPPDRVRWGTRRWEEALAALARLGVPRDAARRLGFPDQGLTDLLLDGGEDLIAVLAQEIARARPTVVLVPAPWDVHPDHNALAVFAHLARARGGSLPGPATVLQYVVHGRVRPPSIEYARLDLSEAMRERKREAILCHGTQLPLRRNYLLRFAEIAERFAPISDALDPGAGHPVRDVSLVEGSLRVEIARPLPPGLGRTRLLVAFEGAGGAGARLAMTLDRRGRIARIGAEGGWETPSAPLEADGRSVRVALPLPGRFVADGKRSIFVKLEREAMRRIGFFDAFGWRQVIPPSSALESPVGPASPEREIEGAIPALSSAASPRALGAP